MTNPQRMITWLCSPLLYLCVGVLQLIVSGFRHSSLPFLLGPSALRNLVSWHLFSRPLWWTHCTPLVQHQKAGGQSETKEPDVFLSRWWKPQNTRSVCIGLALYLENVSADSCLLTRFNHIHTTVKGDYLSVLCLHVLLHPVGLKT